MKSIFIHSTVLVGSCFSCSFCFYLNNPPIDNSFPIKEYISYHNDKRVPRNPYAINSLLSSPISFTLFLSKEQNEQNVNRDDNYYRTPTTNPKKGNVDDGSTSATAKTQVIDANAKSTTIKRRRKQSSGSSIISNTSSIREYNNRNIENVISKIHSRQETTNKTNVKKKIVDTANGNRKTYIPIPDLPDIGTQLQYSRNGHAVLRQYLPIVPTWTNVVETKAKSKTTTTIIDADGKIDFHNLRTKLYNYGLEQQLLAWQQKVHVVASEHPEKKKFLNDESLSTIEKCRTILKEQFHIPIDQLPFLQYFHCWKTIPEVYTLCCSLAQTASILLDVPSVRLYQDSLFWKRCGSSSTSTRAGAAVHDGPTPWHTDAKMAPFDTSTMITFWIPLQTVPKHGSGLIFCSKSHNDFALPYWNSQPSTMAEDGTNENESQWNRLEERYYTSPTKERQYTSTTTTTTYVDYMPLQPGDITVHSGWTLHCSDPCSIQYETIDRLALAISYVDSRAPVRADAQEAVRITKKQQEQQSTKLKNLDKYRKKNHMNNKADREDLWSYQDWIMDVPTDTYDWGDHPLVPIVWPPPRSRNQT